jgi:hypothetical protein
LADKQVLWTEEEAVAWARPHYRPDWLWPLIVASPRDSEVRTTFALAMQGDPLHFQMLLDALEEAGQVQSDPPFRHRVDLIRRARYDEVFTKLLRETPEERAFWREKASDLAQREAPAADKVVIYYDNNPFAAGETIRQPFLDLLRERLRDEGIEELTRESYLPEGEGGDGYTVAVAHRLVSWEGDFRVQQIFAQTKNDVTGAHRALGIHQASSGGDHTSAEPTPAQVVARLAQLIGIRRASA